MEKPISAKNEPIEVELKAGNDYYWCQCGRSKNQPYCDGSHEGTGISSKKFSVLTSRKVWLCQCKKTSTVPYCDGSHSKV